MCGRYVLFSAWSVLAQEFGVSEIVAASEINGEMVPGRLVPAVVQDGRRLLAEFQWGLIPSWAKDPSFGRKMFNARAETVSEKPSFSKAFRRRRCLIPADAFFEWEKTAHGKKPYLFGLKSGEPFGMAGLYETWETPEAGPINSCTIITTMANEIVAPYHDRMPVIIPREERNRWLDMSRYREEELRSLLVSYPASGMVRSEGTIPEV
ncbi:MAG: SOS response-associated peptidase [Smithellaceae bacterium]|nr:SOS response-associated peptidase [Smithellaceae bacterium]